MSSNQFKIYAAGGCGINIISKIHKTLKKEPGVAEINTVFIDTSRSNISVNIPASSIYLIDGLDGSGKKRDSNYNIINETSKDILLQHKPGDINLVIHSASGGSGSVLGPVLVSELLARNETVIVLLVGSTGSRIETENTLKTLKSYEVISTKRNRPVIAHYRENSKDKPRGHVDADMAGIIEILSIIYSGENRELDSADLNNWINYQNVTNFQPKLSCLEIHTNQPVIQKGEALITVVSLTDERSSLESDMMVEYHAVGYISESAIKRCEGHLPMHACITAGSFINLAAQLDGKLQDYSELRNAVVERGIAKSGEASTDDGLVL